MIFSYNKAVLGDTLLVVAGNSQEHEVAMERNGQIVRVYRKDTNQTVAWNIFDATKLIPDLAGQGQLDLSLQQLAALNLALHAAGFTEDITADGESKIVTGFVKSCKKHPDSTHLSVTQTEVDGGEVLQIVCGAANIKAGLKVVVAKPGAMMPDGLIIWPGELRGVPSQGMICSASELNVPNAPSARGILELPFDVAIGIPFDGSQYQL